MPWRVQRQVQPPAWAQDRRAWVEACREWRGPASRCEHPSWAWRWEEQEQAQELEQRRVEARELEQVQERGQLRGRDAG